MNKKQDKTDIKGLTRKNTSIKTINKSNPTKTKSTNNLKIVKYKHTINKAINKPNENSKRIK